MKSDINVTPLIDVLLVLLIIFIVVAPVAPRALDASLPETRDTTDPAPRGLVLDVREDDFSLNSTPVLTLDELESRLRAALETRRDKRAVRAARVRYPLLPADRGARHGH